MIEQDLFDKMLITSHYKFAIMCESVNHPIPQKEKTWALKSPLTDMAASAAKYYAPSTITTCKTNLKSSPSTPAAASKLTPI